MAPALLAQVSTTASTRPRSLAEWRSGGLDYAVGKAIDVGGVLLAIFFAWLVVRLVSRRIEQWGGDPHLAKTVREQRARTSAKLVRNIGRGVLTVVGFLMVLNQLEFNIAPLLASAGVVGLAVSFGSQSLVRDYVTGFFLQLEHQFALGDVIRIGAVEGTVENITLRLVYLRDGNGALHIIPNGVIAQVTNLTRSWGRISVDVEVAWRDADAAIEVMTRVTEELANDPEWKDMLLEPPRFNGIEKLAGGSVTVRAIAKVDPYRRDDVARELRSRIRAELARKDVSTAVNPAPPPPA